MGRYEQGRRTSQTAGTLCDIHLKKLMSKKLRNLAVRSKVYDF
jgi:hypothetical protein